LRKWKPSYKYYKYEINCVLFNTVSMPSTNKGEKDYAPCECLILRHLCKNEAVDWLID
jgi:hypothetical protein